MQLPKEVLAALIALSGVILSVLISFIAGRRVVILEMRKIRFQIQQIYASKLLETRLIVYPQLYSYLSSFSKELRGYKLSRSKLEELLTRLDEWDSKNSILFTNETIRANNRFRNGLIKLLESNDEELGERFASKDFIFIWFRNTEVFELALKSEIGIYGLELSDTSEDIRLKTRDQY